MTFRYLSVCSGIEAASAAWAQSGWEAVAFSQFDPDHKYKYGPDFASRVLAHHYPAVPNLGDMNNFKEWPHESIDLLVGGTPCQSFSVAGLRKGLDDPRGNLALVYLAILERYRPRWFIWENVPGVLSSNQGRDFGAFIGGVGAVGYGYAYRTLDAQYFGLAQRRKRVFVVGYFGNWRPAAAVLFEQESLRWHPAPRRKKGEIAPTIPSRSSAGGGLGTDFDLDGGVIAHSLKADGFDASEDGSGRGVPLVPEISPALKARDHKGPSSDGDGDGAPLIPTVKAIAFSCKDNGRDATEDLSPTLRSMNNVTGNQNAGGQMAVLNKMAVRRLTPRECERLQGFPDDYTLIQVGKRMAADGPRYKAIGNSMAVPVMRWLQRRIDLADRIKT